MDLISPEQVRENSICKGADQESSFQIDDHQSANWLIRKIVESRAYAARCVQWAEQEQHRAKQDEESLLLRYGAQLAEFTRQQLEANGGRRKSLSLPAGTVGFRSERPKIIVDDEAAVLTWARQHHPDLITTVEHLSKSKLNEQIERTGEVPDAGVHIEPTRERFYIK